MATDEMSAHNDLASSAWRTAIIWGPGVLLLAFTGSLGWWGRTIGWTAGLLWLATFCLWNAARCRRVHCLFTGPFFLIMAVVTLLAGFRIVSLGANTWNLLSGTILAGGVVLCCVPEWVWGRYWTRAHRIPECKP